MITFDNFSFRYEERDKFTLKDLNLTIQTGEFVLLTGRSGCDSLPEWVDSTFLPRRVKGGYSVGRTLFAGIEAV